MASSKTIPPLKASAIVYEEGVQLQIPALFDEDEKKLDWLTDVVTEYSQKLKSKYLTAVFLMLNPLHHLDLMRKARMNDAFVMSVFDCCDEIPMERLSEIAALSSGRTTTREGVNVEMQTEDKIDSLMKTVQAQKKMISSLSETVCLLSAQHEVMNAKLDSLSGVEKRPSLLPAASSVSVQTDDVVLQPNFDCAEGTSDSQSDSSLIGKSNVCCEKYCRKPKVKAKTPSNPSDFAERMARVRGLHVNPKSGSEGYSSAASSCPLRKRTWRFRGIEFGFPDGSRLPTCVKMRNGCHCYRCGLKTHLRNECDALALNPQTKWPYDSSLQCDYRTIKQLQSRSSGPQLRSPSNCNGSRILCNPAMMPCPPFVRSGPGIMPGARWSTPMFVCATSPLRPRQGMGGRW